MDRNRETVDPMSTLVEAEARNLPLVSEHAPSQDLELVSRSQKGDTTAFEALFNTYQSDVYRTAYGMMGNVEDAKDMTQEAFVRAYKNIRKFKKQASFRTWITRITTNLCLDELRKRKRRGTESIEENPVAEYQMASSATALDGLIDEEQRALLQKMLDVLPEKYRTLIVLRDVQGLSYAEISDILGCSLGRVKSRLHEARQELRGLFVRRKLV